MGTSSPESLLYPLPTRRATTHLAQRVAEALKPADLVILDGCLGSGKTFFTRALCRALGLDSALRVTSPTFNLVHEYETSPPLAHADVYRLVTAADVAELGLRELRENGWIVIAEWARPYIGTLGGDALVIELGLDPRRARLHAHGQCAERLLLTVSQAIELQRHPPTAEIDGRRSRNRQSGGADR